MKSLWVKYIGEHRDRWDAGFRSPLLRYIYIYIYHDRYIYIYSKRMVFHEFLEEHVIYIQECVCVIFPSTYNLNHFMVKTAIFS